LKYVSEQQYYHASIKNLGNESAAKSFFPCMKYRKTSSAYYKYKLMVYKEHLEQYGRSAWHQGQYDQTVVSKKIR